MPTRQRGTQLLLTQTQLGPTRGGFVLKSLAATSRQSVADNQSGSVHSRPRAIRDHALLIPTVLPVGSAAAIVGVRQS